VEEAPFGN